MNAVRVKQHFEDEAATYIDHIRNFIPHYREQNDLLMQLLPFEQSTSLRVLDLGAGPGVLADLVLEKYPLARLTLFDVAENMIAAARKNLARFAERVVYQKGNFETNDFGEGYDLIVSGLAIHHLENQAKRNLFRRLFAALQPGGLLLIRDIVRGETEQLTALYEKLWCDYIRSQNTDDRAVLNRYHVEDVPAPLEDQLAWLREAGFADVGCHWKHLNFAIFGGSRPG